MKISNLQNINYKPIIFSGKNKTSKPFGLRQLTTDVFQRTTSLTQKIKKCKQPNFEETRTKELYDDVYNKLLEDVPILTKLEIKKPNLIFTENLNATASYDFPTNTIELHSDFKKDLYAYYIYDENNTPLDCEVGFEDVVKLKKLKTNSRKIKIIKLTQEEKELYIKAILAHELRHWAQEHILASTKGCQEPYKYKLGKVESIIEALKEMLAIAQESNMPKKTIEVYKKRLEDTKKEFEYILNFKPKEILDEDFKIETSIIPWETKYWSIKGHFLPAALRYKNSNEEEYLTNPSEIDAYYYQAEFLFREKEKSTNIRLDVYQAMLANCIDKGYLTIEKIKEFGYPPLLEG